MTEKRTILLLGSTGNGKSTIAKVMAEQMNSKLNEIKEGYGTVISELRNTVNNLSNRLASQSSEHREEMSKMYEEWKAERQDYRASVEEMSKRPIHVASICKIM